MGTALINLLLALLVYALIAVALGRPIQPTVLLLPLPVVLLGLFSLGVGLAVSAAAVYFPDVLPTYEILLMAWMYLTPVIYPAELLPESVQNLLRFNPLFHLIQPFRAILVEGRRKGKWQGRTRSNKLGFFQSEGDYLGELVNLNIHRASPWSLQGELVSELSYLASRGD